MYADLKKIVETRQVAVFVVAWLPRRPMSQRPSADRLRLGEVDHPDTNVVVTAVIHHQQ